MGLGSHALVREKAGVFSSSLSIASLLPNSMLGKLWCVLEVREREGKEEGKGEGKRKGESERRE